MGWFIGLRREACCFWNHEWTRMNRGERGRGDLFVCFACFAVEKLPDPFPRDSPSARINPGVYQGPLALMPFLWKTTAWLGLIGELFFRPGNGRSTSLASQESSSSRSRLALIVNPRYGVSCRVSRIHSGICPSSFVFHRDRCPS